MREMVKAGVYKTNNGFKPGYLHFLEEKNEGKCSGFGYDNGNNTIVASDDVWVDYIKGEREEACSAADYMDHTNEVIADLSDSNSSGPDTMNVTHSSSPRRALSETPEVSNKGRKQQFGDSHTTIRDNQPLRWILEAHRHKDFELRNESL
ncbi:hypothetical protein Sjap_022223 [Stephania japonica]|uniref:Uncharacterized protein n=1 Tax=Stephania japonica TaxID=461633 RepID=A0AAP0ENI8_9MAGN